MQKVSKEYRESMSDLLRERSYIMISFGLINQEAQAKARIDSGDFAYFSNKNTLFTQRSEDSPVYATLEENFTKVDGSMFFLPRKNKSNSYYDTGLISKNLVSAGAYELVINLHTAAIDFKGITIEFGENYPVDFDMVSSTGQVVEFRGNTDAVFSTEEVLEHTTSVKFIFYTMKNPNSRLRIYYIRFGYGLVYYNDSVTASELTSYVSPIGADVPQIDFSVTLKNYDQYFNVDNPKSAINFLETGQEMDIYYGYQLPSGDIEWIRGNHLLCSEWESDDYSATIRCQDIFRSMDGEFYRGKYRPNGISYYDLAVEVLQDAGQTSYYIDPRLKRLYTKNPLPRVLHKEALQIIANACRCVLTQTRTGTIQIKSNFAPDAVASANAQTAYSDVTHILSKDNKAEYGSLNTNYTVADGEMYFLPRNGTGGLYTGFVSAGLSDANCEFAVNPVVTITQEAQCMYYGAKLVFGNALPAEFTIRTYNNGELVEEYVNEDEITQEMFIIHTFDDFDTMEIEFTKTAEPFNRIVLNYFAFGDITNFTMRRKDMTSSPKAIKQELIKEVIVPCYTYRNGVEEESLASEEITVNAGDRVTFFVGEPSNRYRATIDDSSTGVSIVDSGCYFATVQFATAGTYRFELYGYRYKIVERYSINSLNPRGKSIKWENPLMSDMTMANDLSEWLGDYYRSGIEYEYDTRGFPEIDTNDIIYQENEFRDGMKVNVYRTTLTFNNAFEGKVTARRQESTA